MSIEHHKEQLERIKETDNESIKIMANNFDSRLEENPSFSQTMNIESDGTLRATSVEDQEKSFFLTYLDGEPENGIYILAKMIKDTYPEFNFTFEKDKHGEKITYTVTKK